MFITCLKSGLQTFTNFKPIVCALQPAKNGFRNVRQKIFFMKTGKNNGYNFTKIVTYELAPPPEVIAQKFIKN